MISIVTAQGIYLDLLDNTTIRFEENSKSIDGNVLDFDWSSSFDMPFTAVNNTFFRELENGDNKAKMVALYSDGILIDQYYIELLEKFENKANGKGVYKAQLTSQYVNLKSNVEESKIRDLFEYEDVITVDEWTPNNQRFYLEEKGLIRKLMALKASGLTDKPWKLPSYSLVDDFNEIPNTYYAETLDKNFGSIVEVNNFTDFGHGQSGIPFIVGNRYVRNNLVWKIEDIRYQNQTYNNTHNFYYPIRVWSPCIPCFSYVYVLNQVFAKLGYTIDVEYISSYYKDVFEKLLILNNYNILTPEIHVELILKLTQYSLGLDIYKEHYTRPIGNWFNGHGGIEGLRIIGSKHIPDISAFELLQDFAIKIGAEIKISGNRIFVKQQKLKQGKSPMTIHKEIQTSYNISKFGSFIYTYEDAENPDNVPDYVINKDGNDKESIIVPIHIRYKNPTDTNFMNYCIGKVSSNYGDAVQTIRKLTFVYSYGYNEFLGLRESLSGVHDNVIGTSINEIIKYCGFIQNYLANPIKNPFIGAPSTIFMTENPMVLDYFENFNLWWTKNNQGIVDVFYAGVSSLLNSSKQHRIVALNRHEEFNEFDFYKYFEIDGRKVFPLARKYTLPLSNNPEIEMECHESNI
jgi:hypothetical protein